MRRSARTWSLIALTAELRQYGGNVGYEDDLTKTYRYDAAVPNHKQLAIGDLVFIRDSKRLIGVSRIDHIISSPIHKGRQRCPECGQVDLKLRKAKQPPWRCSAGHEFLEPRMESILVMGYEAHYGQSFIPTFEAIPVADIKAAALRPNDQLSIEELNLAKLEQRLTEKFPGTCELIAHFLDGVALCATDAIAEYRLTDYNVQFVSSMSDTRERVLKSILQRRGQKNFRDRLIKRYGARCLASGCDLMDIVEAAHIDPYRDANDNHPENGLLLRTDLHTLFDLHLMAIDPNGLVLRFHPKVHASGYAALEGAALQVRERYLPAEEPIARRWKTFLQWK